MKIRDLGQAILDFDLNDVPKAIGIGVASVISFFWFVLRGSAHLYKTLWPFVLGACVFIFFYGLEKDCTSYCWGLVDLHDGYAVHEDFLLIIGMLLAGLIVAVVLDKKLKKT